MFKLEFTTDNAAFEDDAAGESARIVSLVASQIERGARSGNVLDVNGNTVGSWYLQ